MRCEARWIENLDNSQDVKMPNVIAGGLLALVAVLCAGLVGPVKHRLLVFGVTRPTLPNQHGTDGLRTIPGTIMCEDLHLKKTTGHLFTACQDDKEQHSSWFPPNLVFTDSTALTTGAIVRIDPATFTSTKLKLEGFSGKMVTHGIDILNDPKEPEKLCIYIVNHLPNPERWDPKPSRSYQPPERAQIEIFSHVLGTDRTRYQRSVRHPMLRTPNDIVAITPSSFYVTNDHVHYEGLKRTWEDVGTQSTAPITDLVFFELDSMTTKDAAAAVKARIALKEVHNNNGLGRGRSTPSEELAIVDATGGVLTRAERNLADPKDPRIDVLESIQLDSTLDSPSYYEDLWATPTNNASGYIMPGLFHGLKMLSDFPHLDRPIPSVVWHVRANGPVDFENKSNAWEKRMIFADDGRALRSASGAVLIGIDPEVNQGRKQGWLFVTGFGSFAVVAAKVDL